MGNINEKPSQNVENEKEEPKKTEIKPEIINTNYKTDQNNNTAPDKTNTSIDKSKQVDIENDESDGEYIPKKKKFISHEFKYIKPYVITNDFNLFNTDYLNYEKKRDEQLKRLVLNKPSNRLYKNLDIEIKKNIKTLEKDLIYHSSVEKEMENFDYTSPDFMKNITVLVLKNNSKIASYYND